jgi:choline dehydrogenase-like flavoprotein
MAEQLPNPSSRVTLGRRRDSYGQPVANVDWRLSGLDLDSIGRTQICLGDAFAKAGIGVLVDAMAEQDRMPLLGGGYHHMGTTRMSVSPRKGVTDAACRLHECASVYVASSSVFPTAGYANPTLTLIAIADRVAGAIRRDLMHVPDITG